MLSSSSCLFLFCRDTARQCHASGRARRKLGLAHGILFHHGPGRFIKPLAVVAVLLGDALLEGVVGQGFDEQGAQGVEDGGDFCAGLPVLRLEEAEADAAEGVVCDVGVVDASDEADNGGLEGVLVGEGEDDAVGARVVDGAFGGGEGNVPGMQGVVGAEGDGVALGGGRGDFCVFLKKQW